MRAALRVLRGAAVVLLSAVVLGNAALLFSRFALKQEPPHVFGFYPMFVATGSMEPTVPAGAVVVAHAQEEYQVGDIISFRQGGAVVTHRIIGTTAEGYRTQGDANNAPDGETVPGSAVLGKAVLCLPALGALAQILRGPFGVLALAAVGGALVLLPERRGREQYEDTEKKA